MADPVWPFVSGDLGFTPDYGKWNETAQKNTIAYQPEVGEPKIRRRSTAKGFIADATFTITTSQLQTFVSWYEDDCADGSLPFEWAHPVLGTVYRWAFDSDQQPSALATDFNMHELTIRIRRLP